MGYSSRRRTSPARESYELWGSVLLTVGSRTWSTGVGLRQVIGGTVDA